MGGLIGGGVAAGMTSGELAAMLEGVNWDELFGFTLVGVEREVGHKFERWIDVIEMQKMMA